MADITGTDAGETLDGTEGEDVILGLGGDDALNGFGGKDRLDGGTGIDIMRGGEGNDLFLVDDARDLVIEMIGEGDDTVYTSVSYELPASSLANGASIEAVFAVSAASTAPLDVVGNFWGQSLYGNAGVNRLCGMSGNDYLVGNAGNDVLDWGQGADVLRGGTGNDLYYVDEAGILDPFASEPLALGDRVFEGAGEGDDTVYITGETGIFRQLLPTGSEV